jgi:hypothetical protein
MYNFFRKAPIIINTLMVLVVLMINRIASPIYTAATKMASGPDKSVISEKIMAKTLINNEKVLATISGN